MNALRVFWLWLQAKYRPKYGCVKIWIDIDAIGVNCPSCRYDSYLKTWACTECNPYKPCPYELYMKCCRCGADQLVRHRYGKRSFSLWLITLGQVDSWFHEKISPLYRDTVDCELDLIYKKRYVAAWRKSLSGFKHGIGYSGRYRIDGVEQYPMDEDSWRFAEERTYCIGGNWSDRTLLGNVKMFSEDSRMPFIIYRALAMEKTNQCARCWNEEVDYDEYDPRLARLECSCRWEHVYSDSCMLTTLVRSYKRLRREGWTWWYDGRDLTLIAPYEMDNDETLSYAEELELELTS